VVVVDCSWDVPVQPAIRVRQSARTARTAIGTSGTDAPALFFFPVMVLDAVRKAGVRELFSLIQTLPCFLMPGYLT
jgi:hypothetical protein